MLIRQIYKEMDIGTAKEGKITKIDSKTAYMINGIPQYMIDIAQVGENYTVAQ